MRSDKALLEKNFVSAVIYIYNAEVSLPPFLEMLDKYFHTGFLKYELIFVNDASEDKSVEVIREYFKGSREGMVTVLNMSYFQGRECAMSAGVDLAIGDFIYEFESTIMSYPFSMLREVYTRCLEGYDIVSASPHTHSHRLAQLFYALYNRYSNAQKKLYTEAFRILSRRAVNRIWSMSSTLPYRKAVYANCGLPTEVLWYDIISDFSIARGRERKMQEETAVDALILYTEVAYKFSMMFSLLMILFTFTMCVYIVIVFAIGKPVPGYVSTIAVLSFGFFGVDVFLTILIKYASLILKVVFTKQKYMIEAVEKL